MYVGELKAIFNRFKDPHPRSILNYGCLPLTVKSSDLENITYGKSEEFTWESDEQDRVCHD